MGSPRWWKLPDGVLHLSRCGWGLERAMLKGGLEIFSPGDSPEGVASASAVTCPAGRKAVEELQRTQEANRLLLETMLCGVAVVDADGVVKSANAEAQRILRLKVDELTGRHMSDCRSVTVREDGSPFPVEEYPEALCLRTGKAHGPVTIGIRFDDGQTVWAMYSAAPMRDPSTGRVTAVAVSFTDVTKLKLAESRLDASERRFQTLAEAAPVGIYRTDAAGKPLFTNARWYEIAGLDPIRDRGRGWQNVIHADDLQRVSDLWNQALRTGGTFEAEYRFVRPDGSIAWVVGHAAPERAPGGDGRLLGYVGTVTSITERKRSEEALRMSEARYRSLFSSNPDPTWVYALDSLSFLAVNDAAIKQYGYSRHEFLSMTIADIRPAEDVEALKRAIADHQKRGLIEGGLWRHRRKDGTIVDVEISSHNIDFDGRPARIVVARDITERLRTSLALRESEERYRRVLESVRLIAWEFDRHAKRFTFVSPKAEEILGYPLAEWSAPAFWYHHLHPDDREWAVEFSREHTARGQDHEFEYRMIRADGSVVWLRDFTSMVWVPGNGAPGNGAPGDRSAGEETLIRLHGVLVDITERKQTEEALRRSGDLLRLLLSELDHRVRNNLASLSALIDISARSQTSVPEFARSVQGRVQAMATVHGLLSRGHWRTVGLHSLIMAIVPADLRDRVIIDGQDVMMVPQQVTAMGMIFQELTANSLKYGSLGAPERPDGAASNAGVVRLAWNLTDRGPNEPLLMELTWRETGGPRLSLGGREPRVGTALIKGLVRSELRGRVELEYPAEGALHRVQAQLDRTE
jgi:PAS domain S-box-containing protein